MPGPRPYGLILTCATATLAYYEEKGFGLTTIDAPDSLKLLSVRI